MKGTVHLGVDTNFLVKLLPPICFVRKRIATEAHCIHWIKKKFDTLSRNYEKRFRNYEIRKGAPLIANNNYGNHTEATLMSAWW